MNDESPFGWADPEEPEQPDTEEIERLARIFRTEDGAKQLEVWQNRLLFNVREFDDPSNYRLGFLDGQAHIVKMVLASIRLLERMSEHE